MKFNVITHITTSCNYDCSYCDVIKDKKNFSKKGLEELLVFIKTNYKYIERFKFFGGEPLFVFNDIKYIIDNSTLYLKNNYEIVTNTSLLTDEIGTYLEKYFKIIFFSIDTENYFDFIKIGNYKDKYNLGNKLYINLVINPSNELEGLEQFKKLYSLGFRGFNILPVYFTKKWSKGNLYKLSVVMKYIIELSLKDKSLKLYGFQENLGNEIALANNTLFIDVDRKIYYSDIVSMYLGKGLKKDLFLSKLDNISLLTFTDYDFQKEIKAISNLEENIYNKIEGQKELHKMMNYFSKYLNKVYSTND